MDGIRIIETEDGSHSLYNESLRETYHSTHGAIRESRHVFIAMGMDHYLGQNHPNGINVFEMGFGTGLNAVLALEWAIKNNILINYHTIEAYPVEMEIASQLNYFSENSELKNYLQYFHQMQWEEEAIITSVFKLLKIKSRVEDHVFPENTYDVVFFDAFAPNKQEEVWAPEVLAKFIDSMKPGGVLVTYCAKGQLKRDLKSLHCEVESIPGPPGKKEMTRATKTHEPHEV